MNKIKTVNEHVDWRQRVKEKCEIFMQSRGQH